MTFLSGLMRASLHTCTNKLILRKGHVVYEIETLLGSHAG